MQQQMHQPNQYQLQSRQDDVCCYPFYNTLNKYGLGSFTWETIYVCNNEEELNKMEMYFIKELNTLHPNGYNLSLGGDGQSGFKHSEESRRKISKNNWMRGLPK